MQKILLLSLCALMIHCSGSSSGGGGVTNEKPAPTPDEFITPTSDELGGKVVNFEGRYEGPCTAAINNGGGEQVLTACKLALIVRQNSDEIAWDGRVYLDFGGGTPTEIPIQAAYEISSNDLVYQGQDLGDIGKNAFTIPDEVTPRGNVTLWLKLKSETEAVFSQNTVDPNNAQFYQKIKAKLIRKKL